VAGGAGGAVLCLILGRVGLDFSWFSAAVANYGSGAIVYPALNTGAVAVMVGIIILLCVLAALYPALRAARLVPVRAVHHV
jgi:ABC-type lipoprotein release transport system permease subunit